MDMDRTTVKKIISEVNTDGVFSKGGYWLPFFQRSFVWKEEQIYALFDSIMRGYPIGTVLIWKTDEKVKRRGFTTNFKSNDESFDFYSDRVSTIRNYILDGQQRIQSLFLGIVGTYNGKILCFDLSSGIESIPSDIKYKFKFLKEREIKPPYFSISELICYDGSMTEVRKKYAQKCKDAMPNLKEEKIEENIERIIVKFKKDEIIRIDMVNSIDDEDNYSVDDIVEIFIKFNSGGTILGKSELLFSLLSVSWDDAYGNLEELVNRLNIHGYCFTKDFILKSCLSILKKGASYNVDKFKDLETKKNIERNWNRISNAICDVKDYLYQNTYIRSDKALSSYLMLIPLIYFRYYFPEKWKAAKSKDIYILKTLVCKAFSGSPDNLIDNITKRIDLDGDFFINNIFDEIRKRGRILEIIYDDIFQEGYTTKNTHLLFNLLYKNFDYIPAFENNLPQLDHIFPVSLLRTVKQINPSTSRKDIIKYKAADRNQLANLMLLTREENGASGKSDIPPEIWFKTKSKEYIYQNIIPDNPELWKLENYDLFIEKRKEIIKERLKETLSINNLI